jgi:dTDP-4-amino-4,6-dideoxygalactose transaminase
MGEPEIDRMRQALSGRTAGDGPFCRRVEERLPGLLDGRKVLLTSSCTHALELALLTLGVGPGDEVVCPSFTFVSTANAVLRVGARPVFAEIDERTLGLDLADVGLRLTDRTKALLPVHYAGVAPDMDGLIDLARARGLRVVEDAAQGLGATYRGRALGALGDAGCLSFHETKNLACGEGGALVLPEGEARARAEVIREKGTNRSAFLRGEVDKYTWVAEGSSYILSDLLAAVLDAQLDRLPDIQSRRAEVARRYESALSGWARRHAVRLSGPVPERTPNHHIFFLLFPEGRQRDAALDHLRQHGVQAAFHYVPLHSSPFGRTLVSSPAPLPVTDRVAATLLRLPLHPLLSDDDADRVAEAVLGFTP